ncbi:DUF2188 domain-containing protein [Cupriavidus necator]|uniref:DUF2188 domain-containing protein n=1 Tax=Cupriavidus necator TaxID=106590 RepID=UPI00339D3AE5
MPVDDCWAVWTEGRLGRDTFDTQEAAFAAGTEWAIEKQVELFIHGRDGQIRERNSFIRSATTCATPRATADRYELSSYIYCSNAGLDSTHNLTGGPHDAAHTRHVAPWHLGRLSGRQPEYSLRYAR